MHRDVAKMWRGVAGKDIKTLKPSMAVFLLGVKSHSKDLIIWQSKHPCFTQVKERVDAKNAFDGYIHSMRSATEAFESWRGREG